MTSGPQKSVDKQVVYPGENVVAEISIISPEIFKNKLTTGAEFQFREGPGISGKGVIREILNIDLSGG